MKFSQNFCLTCLLWLIAGVVPWGLSPAAPPKLKERRYESGPLKFSEFLGTALPDNSTRANTTTRSRMKYELSVRQVGTQIVVSVKSIELRAVFLPEESWWGPDADQSLLDHEQGHFDIAEISARQMQFLVMEAQANGSVISATMNTKQEAQEAVLQRLSDLSAAVDKKIAEANVEYDRLTRHGLDPAGQHEARRIQQLTLEQLKQKIRKLKSSPSLR